MIIQPNPELTLTWEEDDKTVGVSAPLDIWVAQMILTLSTGSQGIIMDAVIEEVKRLNNLAAKEAEARVEAEDEETDFWDPTVIQDDEEVEV